MRPEVEVEFTERRTQCARFLKRHRPPRPVSDVGNLSAAVDDENVFSLNYFEALSRSAIRFATEAPELSAPSMYPTNL